LLSKIKYLSTIASLRVGEIGYISEESLEFIPLKLLEMGCLPGAEVQLIQLAPLKDPLYICVNGSHLAIRKETADKIKILKSE
jgi:ferrous iron transport protein A